jgi:hypothetical protein
MRIPMVSHAWRSADTTLTSLVILNYSNRLYYQLSLCCHCEKRNLHVQLIRRSNVYADISLSSLICQSHNRNEYQESSWRVKCDRRIRLLTSLPSLSRLSEKCGSLDATQPYGPQGPVTGVAWPSFRSEYLLHDIIYSWLLSKCTVKRLL